MSEDLIKRCNPSTFKVTVAGQCTHCGHVINHNCPNDKAVIKASQRGSNVNISINSTSYHCEFCDATIPHDHRCT